MAKKILVVDDEQPVRHMLRRVLEASGYEPLEAESGEMGLTVDAEMQPDLVITDLKMPGMDGLEMAGQMLDRDGDRPVLLMTAYADLDSARKAVRIGIYEYFLKPIEMTDLMAGIDRALNHRALVVENRAYQHNLEVMVKERTRELAQKLKDLEARDELLQHLLSIQEPEVTLGFAVKLAVGLCGATFGALYLCEGDGFVLRAAFGFGKKAAVAGPEEILDLRLDGLGLTQKLLCHVAKRKAALILPKVDRVRGGFGMANLGMLPVCKGDEMIAVLEVGGAQDAGAVAMADLRRLEPFLPYVAMAVDDCVLQASLPDWGGDVEGLLNESEKWTE